jgi:hypothetical protein
MKRTTSLVAAAALLLVQSDIAAQQKPASKKYEQEPNCKKECTVTIIVPAGCGSGIRVAPDPVTVGKLSKVEITWTIATPGWKFDANGIKFQLSELAKDAIGDPKPDGKNYKVTNDNKKAGIYKYDVNLEGPDNQPCKLDPTVVNW